MLPAAKIAAATSNLSAGGSRSTQKHLTARSGGSTPPQHQQQQFVFHRAESVLTGVPHSDASAVRMNDPFQKSDAIYKTSDVVLPSAGLCLTPISSSASPLGPSGIEYNVAESSAYLLKSLFRVIFPSIPTQPNTQLLVVPCWQKAQNDMRTFGGAVTAERDALGERFSAWAMMVCGLLHERGHWADFIEPSTFYPHFSLVRTSPYLETEDAMSLDLGYDVMDVVCCKVAAHRVWKTQAFLATMFTTAPKHVLAEAVQATEQRWAENTTEKEKQ